MRRMQAIMAASPEGSPRHDAAHKAYRSEAAMVVKVGKLLRVGPRFDRTALRSVPSGPRPCDLGGGGGAPAVNTFRGWDAVTAKEAARKGGDSGEPPPDVA
jgi:hypothetical protein